MKIINWNDIVSSGRDFFQGQKTGITIGTFDGVHAGHKTLIDMCVLYSKLNNLIPLAVTFRFPPKKSLSPLDYPGEILPFACKINLLDKLGIRQVLVIDFSSEFGRMSGEDFVEILRNSLHFNYLAAGYDFRFGRSMESGVPELKIMAEKYHFVLRLLPLLRLEVKGLVLRLSDVRFGGESWGLSVAFWAGPFVYIYRMPHLAGNREN